MKDNKSTPLFITFSTQKGGVGKTALTVITASYLHYIKGYNVGVIDCDCPQYSISEMRDRDIKQIQTNPHYAELASKQFATLNKSAYPVEASTVTDAITAANDMIKSYQTDFDIIFFDLPGTLNTDGFIDTVSEMDYIFSPISADRLVLESTLIFALSFSEMVIQTKLSKTKGLYLLWNLVDLREQTELYDEYTKLIQQIGLNVLSTRLPDTKRFRKELSTQNKPIFRSTMFPVDKHLAKGSRIDEFINEFCQTIKTER